jgi:hypothetical protein
MRRTSRLVALLVALLGLLGTGAFPVRAQEMGSPAITGLLVQFPSTIAGSPVEILTYRGDEWLAGFADAGGRDVFLAYLGELGVSEDLLATEVALASGVFVNSLGASTALTAIAVCPAGAFDIVARTLPLYGTVTEQPVPPAAEGELVTGTATTATGQQIRAMARADVVWLIDAGEPAIPEIMAVIPATSACEQPAVAQ